MSECKAVKIKDLKIGEMFKRRPGTKRVYVRQAYDRGCRMYEAQSWDDTSEFMYFKRDVIVYVGFTF